MENQLGISKDTVTKFLNSEGFRNYRLQMMQALKDSQSLIRTADFGPSFSVPQFSGIMFLDEAVFHLDGGINTHNCTHWSRTNPTVR